MSDIKESVTEVKKTFLAGLTTWMKDNFKLVLAFVLGAAIGFFAASSGDSTTYYVTQDSAGNTTSTSADAPAK